MWFKVEGFKDLLRSWWQGIVVRGSANFSSSTSGFLGHGGKREKPIRGGNIIKKGSKGKLQKVGVIGRSPLEIAFKGIMVKGRGQKYGFFSIVWQMHIIGRLQLDHLSLQEAKNLEIPFSEEEVHSALMEMNGDKAPGLDGFTVAF
ncbi:hypothetical protein CK203_095198 [Vitis vinifera]|uniref:Reverse transcriptase domain-containing protein n=1 Tax=Vitis vinifera TaxID=29760 RepID=A0A438E105_VITVI|nr:hypothetical protein CK203_095198 [Vitis vinifera]